MTTQKFEPLVYDRRQISSTEEHFAKIFGFSCEQLAAIKAKREEERQARLAPKTGLEKMMICLNVPKECQAEILSEQEARRKMIARLPKEGKAMKSSTIIISDITNM